MKHSGKAKIVFLLLVGAALLAVGYWGNSLHLNETYKTKYEESVLVRFDMEIFDTITTNYWQKVNEPDLAKLYQLALTRAASTTEEVLPSATRTGVAEMLSKTFERLPEEARKEISINTGILVLTNLAPLGRSGLLSDRQETAFRDNVNNINPETGLAEPTLSSKMLSGGTLYMDLSKISNTTLQEVANRFGEFEGQTPPTGLIIDVRSNVGGALDFAKYFFAFFIGPNQYAYDLFHQGDFDPERTPNIAKVDFLEKLQNIVVLIDESSQSTSELLATMFQKFNLAKVIGVQSRGWGTVENTFPLETNIGDGNKYSVLLVHSLTLRSDNEPIETRGVEPDINLSDKDWRTQISRTFSSQSFIKDLLQVLEKRKNAGE
ncbi:MAG: S41 family peptidase [bacterium]